MHSKKAKVLQTILGCPMLTLVERALAPLFGSDIYAVVGYGREEVRKFFCEDRCIEQEEQLGTGHALSVSLPVLLKKGYERVLIVNGDAPLLSTALISDFLQKCGSEDLAFVTTELEDPGAYGRVVRKNGTVTGIVEAGDYQESVHGISHEINVGLYDIRLDVCEAFVPDIPKNGKSGEYYITDLVELCLRRGKSVTGLCLGRDLRLLGVNSPKELVVMEDLLRKEIVSSLLDNGVMLHARESIRISPEAVIEPGAEITGPCEIYGKSHVHAGACISSHCVIQNAEICSGAVIHSFTHIDGARIESNALVGPFARLRPGAHLEENSHVGNFVELKKARLGQGAKANHLTYLGDCEIGSGSNIGAGTITCNYDGKNKHKTLIGEKAFIGSNTALVAPVTVGKNALVGAGSTITRDVPDDTLAVARTKQKNIGRRIPS